MVHPDRAPQSRTLYSLYIVLMYDFDEKHPLRRVGDDG